MAVTVTTQVVDGVTVIVAEHDTSGVSIAINYANTYIRLATAMEKLSANVVTMITTLNRISANLSSINSNLSQINANTSNIRVSLSNMNANLSVMRFNSTTIANLASGNGIHTVSPYESFGAISLYKLYAEEGEILNTKYFVSDQKEQEANSAIGTMMTKVQPFRSF